MGHALFATLQDILIRYRRQQGYAALWLPGYDHAGSATQQKIDEYMTQHGIENTPESFQKISQAWTTQYRERIAQQLKRLGASADWSRATFTLDDRYSQQVSHAFITLYQRNLIYHNSADGQWYLRLSRLAQPLIDALDRGELEIHPRSATRKLRLTPDGEPLTQARDWCISRQIQWGHQIPTAWCNTTKQWFVITPGNCPAHLQPSPDRLDTWFSSSLWAWAALSDDDRSRFFPADLLETGYDISFFWAARMAMMSLELTGRLPFKALYLHGLMRDGTNRKMSKSAGNGIDPLTLIDQYGADALRFALAANQMPGKDSRLNLEHIQTAHRLTIKLWNAARFILSNTAGSSCDRPFTTSPLLAELDELDKELQTALENYQFRQAAQKLRIFIYQRLCSHYIELFKRGECDAQSLRYALRHLLMLLHPFMPFLTEALWSHLDPNTEAPRQLISTPWASLGV